MQLNCCEYIKTADSDKDNDQVEVASKKRKVSTENSGLKDINRL